MSYAPSVFTQAIALMAIGGGAGLVLGKKVEVTELP